MSGFPYADVRARLGLTQQGLAKASGVSKRTIATLETAPDKVSALTHGRVETCLRELLADAPATTEERVDALEAQAADLTERLAEQARRIDDLEAALRVLAKPS